MFKSTVILIIIFLIQNNFLEAKELPTRGTVVKIYGRVFKNTLDTLKRVKLKVGDVILQGEGVSTGIKSFVKINTSSGISIMLGENSHTIFSIEKTEENIEVLKFIKGKIRALIDKTKKRSKKIKINTGTVSIGVRGTQLLSNLYSVSGESVTDIVLLKGKIDVDISKFGLNESIISLEEGKAFNTKLLKERGLKSIRKIPSEVYKSLMENPESFLQNSFDKVGSLIRPKAISFVASTPAGIAALGVHGTPFALKSNQPINIESNKEKNSAQNLFVYKLNRDKVPVDIWDAKQRRENLMKENVCFFWIYRSVPSAIKKVRLRREEDCDEE